MQQKILVFIPTYTCENQICRVINQFNNEVQSAIDTVLILDNQSEDKTLYKAIEESKNQFTKCNIVVCRNNNNYGLGGSHKAAFEYGIKKNFDYLIVLHGDDQARIIDLIPKVNFAIAKRYDCFLGARFMKESKLQGYSNFRSFGNRIYNFIFSLVCMRIIFDLGSGLNLYRLSKLKNYYYKKFPDDLTFNYVMLLYSYHFNHKVGFFPISWREDDQISNVRLFKQALKVLKLLINFAFTRKNFFKKDFRKINYENYGYTEMFYNKLN